MKRSGNRTLQLAALLLLALPAMAEAALNASLDRYTISMGETARLTLVSDGPADPSDADLDALRDDFEILQRSSRVSTQIINGQRQQQRELVLEITPRREGNFVIPAFTIDGQRSEALAVTVTPEPQMRAGEEVVLFEAELNRDAVYVQGQLLLTLRVQQAVNLESRSVTELAIDGAYVKTLGQNSFQRTIDGRPWLVHEIRYAIFPESSGELVIPAQTFSGRLSNGRRSLFDTRPAGRLLSRSTEELVVDVLPRPAGYNEPLWLPAADLQIEEQWSAPLDELKVGDSITRSITLTGEGLQGAQLPPISTDAPEGLRAYPDQPTINDIENETGVTGIRTDSVALVAVRAGDYELPGITISWWDTEADRQRLLRLPARKLSVRAAASVPTDAGDSPSMEPGTEVTAAFADAPVRAAGWWPALAAALGIGWLMTLVTWYWSRRRQPADRLARDNATSPTRAAVLTACKRNDAPGAEKALRDWLLSQGHRGNLRSWALMQEDPTLPDLIEELERALYAPQTGSWHGAALAQAVKRSGDKAARKKHPSLPPLYPSTG